jgi:sulfide:quinone oxidoreductase
MSDAHRHRVVIAGAGVAGLEALIGIHALAGGRVDTTVISPEPEFFFQAHTVEHPFARPAAHRWPVSKICAAHDAHFVQDQVSVVDPVTQRITTLSGGEVAYDSLLVAVGAHRERVFDGKATVFAGDRDAEAFHGLIQDVEGGYIKSVAFVVPAGVTWPLPLYELALMTAQRAFEMSVEVRIAVITPEEYPMGVFGRAASEAVQAALDRAGIQVMTATYVRQVLTGAIVTSPSGETLPFERVVCVPRLAGPDIAGLPADENGFVLVDGQCRVRGWEGVYAAGDGTTYPIKQGGLAAQQADAVASAIAARAGAPVKPQAFDPVLRAKLLTGSRAQYLREAVAEGEAGSTAADHTLWWPPSKVAAPHLAGYLEALEAGKPPPHVSNQPPAAIHGSGDPAGGIDLLER